MSRHVFPIDNKAISRFRKDEIVDDVDRHKQPIKGRVIEVKKGNKVALVIVESTGE